MEVKFANTFADSLDRLAWHNTKIYKFYSFFRNDIPRFVKNVWKFRKALNEHYWFDHHGMLTFMDIAVNDMANNIEKYGIEIDSSRLKKVMKMRRLSQIINNYNDGLKYVDMAEKELGEMALHEWDFEDVPDMPGYSRLIDKDTPEEKEHKRAVYDRAHEIERQEWDEFCEIIKGQDISLFNKDEDWEAQYDGSGLKYWWD